jgi:hypothetical protein
MPLVEARPIRLSRDPGVQRRLDETDDALIQSHSQLRQSRVTLDRANQHNAQQLEQLQRSRRVLSGIRFSLTG